MSLKTPDRRLSVAPMMDRTDRHGRFFLRLISRRVLLYTEMIACGAILNGNRERVLGFDAREHALALQLGGADARALAEAARIAEDFGYDEVNLNLGCPSDRVQTGRFGACLMAEPERVADCVGAMIGAVDIPVTVKSRIGIDEKDSYDELGNFVKTLKDAGCRTFVIHARKAWLKGLSPRENREIPPLEYDFIYRIKEDFPNLEIILNGGVRSLKEAEAHLRRVDGVMIGRAAYEDPYMLATADRRFFGDRHPGPSREEVIDGLLPYVRERLADGEALHRITRHILGLFRGVAGARAWRRHLSENVHAPGAGAELIEQAAALVPEAALRARPEPTTGSQEAFTALAD